MAEKVVLRLAEAVGAFSGPAFAVVDGGHFDDLPVLLRREGLFARSLFLGHTDDEIEAAGPWLVSLDQRPDAFDTIISLVGDKPAAVFWTCSGGETLLYRHLRTLNLARIPEWAARNGAIPEAQGQQDVYETVYFRHFDPSVLGSLLPVLEASQFSRVMGPAEEVAFEATDYGGFRRVVTSPNWPSAPPGLLTIRSAQMTALTERRLAASYARIRSYLRSVVPEVAPKMSPDALRSFVEESDKSGRDLGIRTEAGHCRWAYLVMMSEGRILKDRGAVGFIRDGNEAPDRQVKALMGQLIHYLKSDLPRQIRGLS